jgi:hypothetical protein
MPTMDQLLDDQVQRPELGDQLATTAERKLPVLFHLLDVSRPRAPKPAVQPVDLVSSSPAAQVNRELELELSLAPLSPAPLSPIAEFRVADEPAVSALTSSAAVDQSPEPSTDFVAVPQVTPLVAAETTPAAGTVQMAAPAPKAAPPVSLPATRHINRRKKPAVADDWFAAHGKFIAVAFVLALIGTVYFARTSRRPVKQEEMVRPVAPLIELASVSQLPTTTTTLAASTSPPSLATTSAAVAASPTPATVELHMPTTPAPQVAATNEKQVGSDNLFVFPPNKPDERVAARPESAANASRPAAAATPPATATMPPAYPVTASPPLYAGAATYPQTAAPPLAAASPPNAYQQALSPPGPPLPAAPPAADYGHPSPYQSPDNVARGPRYERTGSGNY